MNERRTPCVLCLSIMRRANGPDRWFWLIFGASLALFGVIGVISAATLLSATWKNVPAWIQLAIAFPCLLAGVWLLAPIHQGFRCTGCRHFIPPN